MMKKAALAIFSLLLILAVSIYFRSFPVYFPQLSDQAVSAIDEEIHQAARKEINAKFAGYGSLAKEKLQDAWITEHKQSHKKEIEKRVQTEYSRLKAKYQDKTGQTFLSELDCWHWARYTQNLLKLGRIGDAVIAGKQSDTLMLFPFGSALPWNQFLFYFSALLYKTFSWFCAVPLISFLFYLPLFFSAILLVLLFFFCCRYWGEVAAVIACFTVGLAPILLARSSAGWFDMDVLSLIFPLLVVWAYLSAYQAKRGLKFTLRIFLAGFWLGLFAYTWAYWWFIFLVIIAYEFLSCILPGEIKIKKRLAAIVLFAISGAFWIFVFCRQEPLLSLIDQIRATLGLNSASSGGSIWPNVYYTVSELKKAPFLRAAKMAGGAPLFFSGIASMILLFLKRNSYTGVKREAALLFLVWFAVMFFACAKGIRFTMFLLIPLGVFLGWMMENFAQKPMVKNALVSKILVVVMLLGIFFPLFRAAQETSETNFPLMDSQWHQALVFLQENTPQDAVINSWWDFGDWFKAVSQRRVIFDGQSQNTPQAYWMAKVLLANDEVRALAILRMLNNAGNRPFEIINGYLADPYRSIFLLEKCLALPQNQARELLNQNLPLDVAEQIGRMLFTKPGHQAYFVVDYSMLDKIQAISYLGSWNFAKAYLANQPKQSGRSLAKLQGLGLSQQNSRILCDEFSLINKTDIDRWISAPLRFHSGIINGKEKKCNVFFGSLMAYSPQDKDIFFFSSEPDRPSSLYVFADNKLVKKDYPREKSRREAALLFKEDKDYRLILMSPALAESLFVRLYYLQAKGLKYFKPLTEENDNGNYIRIFEILWE